MIMKKKIIYLYYCHFLGTMHIHQAYGIAHQIQIAAFQQASSYAKDVHCADWTITTTFTFSLPLPSEKFNNLHNLQKFTERKLYNNTCSTDFTFPLARWAPVQPATIDPTLDLCTRYPLRLGGPRQCGIQSLPDTSAHGQHWELNPRLCDLESNALSARPHASTSSGLCKKATIHQVTTMLATSENVLFPGHNHLLTPGTDDPSLAGAWTIIKVSDHQHQWLVGGYDLEIGYF